MIYIEYFSRQPGVSIKEFREGAGASQSSWDSSVGEDRLIWSAGRTWRLGPEPGYLAVWYSPNHDFDRLDDWDRLFRAGKEEAHDQKFRRYARIERAGCYDELRPPVPAQGGIYYAEFFLATGSLDAIAAHFDERARRHGDLTLNLLCHRIGGLAPDPGGLAVWTTPSFAALAAIARDLDGVREPLERVTTGTYHDFAREIL